MRLRLPIILLVLILTGTACHANPMTLPPLAKFTPSATGEPVVMPVSTPTATPFSSPIVINTQQPTTSLVFTPTSTLTPYPPPAFFQQNESLEILFEFSGRLRKAYIRDAIIINQQDFWVYDPPTFYHLLNGIIVAQIADHAEYAQAFEVSQDTIWVFDVGTWPRPDAIVKLFQMDIDGDILIDYELPKSILVDSSGNYIEYGLTDLWWGAHGELLLGGEQGFYQLLDATGALKIEKLSGREIATQVVKTTNPYGTTVQPAQVSIDNRTIPITTTHDRLVIINKYIGEVIVSNSYQDFYVQVSEYSGQTERISLRCYSIDGRLVGETVYLQKPEIQAWYPFTFLGRDERIYAIIRRPYENPKLILVNIP